MRTTVSTIPYSLDLRGTEISFLTFFEFFPSFPINVSVFPIIISSPLTRIAGHIIPSVSNFEYNPCLSPEVT